MGKILAGSIILTSVVAAVALYYLQVYAYYVEVDLRDDEPAVVMTSLVTGAPEPIIADDFSGIDSDSSPLRYRACFTTPHSQAMLTETYEIYDEAVPLVAPNWFDCFNATEVGEALETGQAIAFLGEKDVIYGFDRIVAVMADGRGFVWHQLNDCGADVFDGKPLPEGCPPVPERN
ncbi:DUF6446 family protein [Cochlodiniinecator piscidefendens]|uniref:DUF6446 family protein n=1 Tax=Cochlodiniinecator piscidefendens TaxID=2715756 RepID=UPI00140A4CF5|nr:DUF6446 family protein [Cochlodiniinecator piscidefendens]